MHSDELKVAARHLFQSTQKTMLDIANQCGVSLRTVSRWSSQDGGWQRLSGPVIVRRAHEAADEVRVISEELSVDPGTVAQRTEQAAVDARSEVLLRHRREWGVVRGLLAEAIKARDFERAKLAKITAETLAIVQANESRAWGLDQHANFEDCATVVVIERSVESPRPENGADT